MNSTILRALLGGLLAVLILLTPWLLENAKRRRLRKRARRENRPCIVCGRVTPFDFCSLDCRDAYFGGEPPWDEVPNERRIV